MRVRRLAALALLAPALARAEAAPPPQESGPIFALRAGLGIPSGDVASAGPALADVVERKVPLGFELGYRVTRRFWAQLHFELSPATAASALCAGGSHCTASDARLGLTLLLRLLPGARVDPWIGGGVGVEVLNAEGRDPATGAHTDWTWAGLELPYVEAGADVAITSWIAVGPWASLSFARFTSDSARVEGGETVSGAVHGRATHRWLCAGLQATLRL